MQFKGFARFKRDCRGATVIEYGLIASLIVIALVAGLSRLGGGSGGMWTNVSSAVVSAG